MCDLLKVNAAVKDRALEVYKEVVEVRSGRSRWSLGGLLDETKGLRLN